MDACERGAPAGGGGTGALAGFGLLPAGCAKLWEEWNCLML